MGRTEGAGGGVCGESWLQPLLPPVSRPQGLLLPRCQGGCSFPPPPPPRVLSLSIPRARVGCAEPELPALGPAAGSSAEIAREPAIPRWSRVPPPTAP